MMTNLGSATVAFPAVPPSTIVRRRCALMGIAARQAAARSELSYMVAEALFVVPYGLFDMLKRAFMRGLCVLCVVMALHFADASLSPYAHKYFDDSSQVYRRIHRRRSAQHAVKRLSLQEYFIDTVRAVSGVGLRLMDSTLACTEKTHISERPSGGSSLGDRDEPIDNELGVST
uniref:Uncharacterized protein n=1 Tax=Ascaris lumbricoides TaxID=6252 RepID=A0A0M3HY62_ASCLU